MRWVAGIAAVLLIALPVVMVPRPEVDDGLEQFHGEKRAAAEEALRVVDVGCRNEPFALLGKLRVISVREIESDPDAPVQEPPLVGYEVRIQTHGPFAIPTGTITVREWSVQCL